MREHNKGVMLCFGSSASNSTFTVSSKYLLNLVSQSVLMPLWFISASVMLFFAAFFSRKSRLPADLKSHWKAGVVIGLTNLFAAALFFTSVKVIGPSPTVFLAKFDVIFIVILGFIFLGEKLNGRELLGVSVAVAGGFIYAFSFSGLTSKAFIGLLAAFAVGVNTLFARFYTQNVPVSVLQLYRTSVTAVGFLAFSFLAGTFFIPEARLLVLIVIGSFFSAVLGIGLYYSALKRIKASTAAIIRNLDPFFVAIYAYLVFHTFPSLREWLGGITILIGVTITVIAMNSAYSKNYKKAGETQTVDV